MVNGIRALLYLRRGAACLALDFAIATLSMSVANSVSHQFYVCEYVVSRLIAASGSIIRLAEIENNSTASTISSTSSLLTAKCESLRGLGELQA